MASTKQAVIKALVGANLLSSFDRDAVSSFVAFVDSNGGGSDSILSVIQAVRTELIDDNRVTRELLERHLQALSGGAEEDQIATVVSAFDVPKISYDPIHRKFFAEDRQNSLLGNAQAKHRVYADRLQLLQQRIRRNRMFRGRTLLAAQAEASAGVQLTELAALKGSGQEAKIVMGCISRLEDGRYFLEDASGQVPMDLSAAEATAGLFTENCVVVAEGSMGADAVFHVAALGFPPCEERADLPQSAAALNFFGGPPVEPDTLLRAELAQCDHPEERVVLLQNVWLDRQETMDALGKIFSGFQDAGLIPPLFVLMGNFHSGAAGGEVPYPELRDCFTDLANLIRQFPLVRDESMFVFVPGPDDPSPGPVLPQAPLPSYFSAQLQEQLPNAVFTSNPCRIRYRAQEIVVFRYDLLKKMRRQCLLPPREDAGTSATAMFGHLALTVLQQSHLCPLPLVQQPVYWQLDHALQLYPLPHLLVLADASPQAMHRHAGCLVVNPGHLSEGLFACYVPAQEEVEMSAVPGALEEEEGEDEQREEQQQEQQEEEVVMLDV